MPDPHFADPRLAAVYDALDPDRSDLEAYVGMVTEFGAASVVDVGCGTGCLAVLLAARGVEVMGVDPARASLDVARSKPFADRVRWVQGVASDLPAVQADLALMTGNVAQAIVDPADWAATLGAVASRVLAPDGRLVFETRDPTDRAWERWTPAATRVLAEVDGVTVTSEIEVLAVELPLVSFRTTFTLDGEVLVSDSTLRFRDRAEIVRDLTRVGLVVEDVRDAPDRPGREFVFVARRIQP